VQYVFLWASRAPNSRAAPGSAHSSYATEVNPVVSMKREGIKREQPNKIVVQDISIWDGDAGDAIPFPTL